jgi:hypothetical protein
MNRNVVKNLSTNTFPDTCEIAQKTQVCFIYYTYKIGWK